MLIDDKKHSNIISVQQAINLVKCYTKLSCFLNTQQVIPQLAVKWCPWSMSIFTSDRNSKQRLYY